MFDEITRVEEEISRFRSTTGNLQDYIPLLRLNPFSFGSKKAGEMRDRRDVYLTALNKGLEDRMEKGTHRPCIQANVIIDEEAKLNSEELTSISLTMLSGGLDVSIFCFLDIHNADQCLALDCYNTSSMECCIVGSTSRYPAEGLEGDRGVLLGGPTTM
jgi:hypothetical protein